MLKKAISQVCNISLKPDIYVNTFLFRNDMQEVCDYVKRLSSCRMILRQSFAGHQLDGPDVILHAIAQDRCATPLIFRAQLGRQQADTFG